MHFIQIKNMQEKMLFICMFYGSYHAHPTNTQIHRLLSTWWWTVSTWIRIQQVGGGLSPPPKPV
jgi:hypothetical protein